MLLIGEQRMLRHNTMTEVDYRGTLYAASMARDLLWEGENNIDLDDFVLVSQT
jgi:glycerol-3-phosphate O-acyltransferase/dihydroxyacetone phosphate acyltransferase